MRARFRTSLAFIVVILLAGIASAPVFGQLVGGTIAGSVEDPSHAAVDHAEVVIHNLETGTERRLVTAADGSFSAPSIPVGVYSVVVTHEGFAPLERTGIALTIGQSIQLHLELTLGGVQQSVTVDDTPASVDVSTLQTQGLVNEQQVKQLPLNGRSFDQLLQLNPASISYTTQRSGGVGTSNSSVGNMFSISGRRPQDNLFLLNGIEYTGASLINVTPGGTSGQLLGVEAVREFNVVSDTYGANYGKRAGAQISIVTASGQNTVHGSAYEFLRNSSLDARNYFDQADIPGFQRNDFGASLGGPLRKDKLFLFGNYEGYRQRLGLSDVTFVPDTQARLGYLPDSSGHEKYVGVDPGTAPLFALWPEQNGPELLANGLPTGIAEAFSNPIQHVHENFGTTRFDANLTGKDLFFGVYTIDDSDAISPSANPYSSIYERLREQVLSGQEQHVFSPTLLNTLRLGYSRAAFYFNGIVSGDVPGWAAGGPVGAIVISGSTASNGASQITLAGANVGSNNKTVRNLFTADDHIYWTHGKHQVEAGIWLQRLQSNDNLAQNQFGQASFSTLSSFLAGNVSKYTIVPEPTELAWRALYGAWFLEDAWKVTPRLELRAGFRAESSNGWNEAQGRAANYGFTDGVINTTPTVGESALSENRAKFLPEPRVALTWDAFGNGKTAVRASFGLHRALLDTLDYRLDQAAPFNTTLAYSKVSVDQLSALSSASATGGKISPSSVQQDIQTPAVLAWTFKVEQEIAPRTSLTVGYVGSHAYHQILSVDLNTPPSVICPDPACPAGLANGTIYYTSTTLANTKLANTTSWASQGISSYHALEVDVKRQYAHGFQLRGVYTWSKNLDDGSAWNTSVSANTPAFVSYPNNPKVDYGLAATNIAQSAAINGTWEVPVGRGHAALAKDSELVERLIGGWSLNGIATLQSGFPFSPQLGYNPTGNGDSRNPARPSVNPDFTGKLYPHTAKQWFNPLAFQSPVSGTFGDVKRDSLEGPGLTDVDLSLAKNFAIHDRAHAQFRAEYFNVLNHTNFTTPNAVVLSAADTYSPTAGVLTGTATTSRQLQFALKVLF